MPKPDSLALIINSLFRGRVGWGQNSVMNFTWRTEDTVREKYKG